MRKTVLIVEDNIINREMLKHALRNDYDILEAKNGLEALAVMRSQTNVISAVLLDILMPVMDGYETLRQMRDDPLLANMRVIVVTGSDAEEACVRALSLGAYAFVRKPYDYDAIRGHLRRGAALAKRCEDRQPGGSLRAKSAEDSAADEKSASVSVRGGRKRPDDALMYITLAFSAIMLALVLHVIFGHGYNNYNSFAEDVLTLSDGWMLEDGSGMSRALSLPETVVCGEGGVYTLSRTLPRDERLLASPTLCFYSNYVDVEVLLNGESLYAYPAVRPAFSGATGNTYHFVRLPTGYAGGKIIIKLRCQLGENITYLLKAPLLGSKATMLRIVVWESLPAILLAGCMLIVAAGLIVLRMIYKGKSSISRAAIYTALFAVMFACYIFCETVFAQILTPNGYLMCFITLMLLALMPIPLMGIFADDVSYRFRFAPTLLMALCFVNLAVQTILNFTGVYSYRAALPATHAVIIASISIMAICMFLSDSKEKPNARKKLLLAAPMITGGLMDILLLALNRPSFNNSFWFTIGVTSFIILQFAGFVRDYFKLYRVALETEVFRDMAYCDALTGIGNRNAYERKLKALSDGALTKRLCCVVLDINDLKRINDTYGHQAGDRAIVEIGAALRELTPDSAFCFRTGGDEFVILLEASDEASANALVERIAAEIERRGRQCVIPISLAIGLGHYEPKDGNINDFIRRVDAMMYAHKREVKSGADYWFNESGGGEDAVL